MRAGNTPGLLRQPTEGAGPAGMRERRGDFLAVLPLAAIAVIVVIAVLAGVGWGFVPMLSLGPALAATSGSLSTGWSPTSGAMPGTRCWTTPRCC